MVKLQLRLRELGYYGGKADGGFGAITESAVKKAQEAFGLEQTGVADDALQQKLYADEEAADEETADEEPGAGSGPDAEAPAEQEAEAVLVNTGGLESTCPCRRCGFDSWVGKVP